MPLVDPVTMSAPSTKAPSTAAGEAKPKPLMHPIPLADTPLAQGVANARPAVLLGLLALRFNALVADPAAELQAALPVVTLVQLAYVVLCLPAAGSQAAKAAARKPRPGEKRKHEVAGPSQITSALLAVLLSSIVTPAVYILFVLFGAPFLDYTTHTVLCAAHFSVLAIFPTVYTRGVDYQALVTVAGAAAPMDETFGALVGAVLGSWLGAVPIPLDWDRDWQRWPVTIVVGMYAGSCLGAKLAGMLFYGSRWETSSTKADLG